MNGELIALLNAFGSKLQGSLAFSLSDGEMVDEAHPLAGEISAALQGHSASLPYLGGGKVTWATFAPTAHELRGMIEDLRCWILPSYGWESTPSIISTSEGAGGIGALLLAHSPHGYFRWNSRQQDFDQVVERLATMRRVVAQAPPRATQMRPTIAMLRRMFTLGLATGDRDTALQAIDQIDRLQLDTASNALSMRIRLAAAFGDDRSIVEHPQLDDLLSTRLPRRVVESVLVAHHTVYLTDLEIAGAIGAALAAYRPLHDRLAGLATDVADDADIAIVRMAAYDAATAKDWPRLKDLLARFSRDAVVSFLAADLSETVPQGFDERVDEPSAADVLAAAEATSAHPEQESVTTPSGPAEISWALVPSWLNADGRERLADFLQHATQRPDDCDPGDGDFLIELFTDGHILADASRLVEVDQILTTVIDAYVCEDQFPRRGRLALYQAVLDVWSSSRATSTDPIDGQLLLTLADALLRLDGGFEKAVATALAGWWNARPVRSRLAWLSEALELLTEQSASQDYLTLWYSAATFIKLDHHGLAVADLQLWLRLGRRLGLDATAANEALGGVLEAVEAAGDPLGACGFKKIAIVSLHERPANEAALEIRERTCANVVVVVDHAAGEGTSSAATADVILFVWGANKHAVYRAFYKVRDRLEYVQGTGSASIVRALERRVSRVV